MVTLKAMKKGNFYIEAEKQEDGTLFIMVRPISLIDVSQGEKMTAQELIDGL